MSSGQPFEFDFALSFAGEDRRIAEALAEELRNRGAYVFYDRDFKVHLWGKRLSKTFVGAYGTLTRFVVPFISKHYAEKDYPQYEFAMAKKEALKRPYEFMLPLRLDDTILVGLPNDVGFIDLRKEELPSVAKYMIEKLEQIFPEQLRQVTTQWIATFGLAVEDIAHRRALSNSAPSDYIGLCDWMEEDLKARLKLTLDDHYWYPEPSLRDGECLSVRIAFEWNPLSASLDFGDLDCWEILELRPFTEVYPNEDQCSDHMK